MASPGTRTTQISLRRGLVKEMRDWKPVDSCIVDGELVWAETTHGADTLRTMSDPCVIFAPNALRGKLAIVTGGGTGIGYKIAEAFLRHGAVVALGSRREEVVASAAEALCKETGGRCLAFRLDVRDAEACESFVDSVVKAAERPVDVLVNCAAGNFLAAASALSARAFRTVLDIDTTGTFLMSTAVFRKCWQERDVRAQCASASVDAAPATAAIINVSATLHVNGVPLQVHAGSAKAAIEGMTRHLACEWGRHGVRVVCVAPGPIRGTEGFSKLGGFMPEEALRQYTSMIPLRRTGTREEIAAACVFLASGAAAYVTGTTLVVDGGNCLTGPEHFMWSKL